MNFDDMGARCPFATPKEFASAYFYKPMIDPLGMGKMWALQYNVCHFNQVSDALDAQKALLQALEVVPEGMTLTESVDNATKQDSGLLTYNEIVVAPFDDTVTGGLFWAHSGGFRSPLPTDIGAVKIACHLNATGSEPLNVFELGGVNLERPFEGCNSHPSNECLSNGLDAWQKNMAKGSDWIVNNMVRLGSKEEFLALLRDAPPGACQHMPLLDESAELSQGVIV